MRFIAPELEPKLATILREGYSRHDFGRDALAGIVVGIVALPLAIAFAIASGVRPEQGLYTAIVAGCLISLFGGSRVQIGGPTGAFVVLIAGIIARHGYEGLLLATLMAGVLLIVMALARLGDVIRFVPYPVTVGFTSGIALIIAVGQIGDALGLRIENAPPDFWGRCTVYARHLGATQIEPALVFLGTIAIVQLWPRVTRRVPGPLIALLAMTVVARLAGLDVETVGSRFGTISAAAPRLQLPSVDLSALPALVSPAISIALLVAIESLLSALVADGMIGGRHRSNAELMGQGIANIGSVLFGGIPATGAIARTATNVRNGGRTPIAGLVHAATLLIVLLAAGRLAALIPMASLAGILIVVAYNMSEWHAFVRLFRGPRSDVLVLATTFVLTIVVDLTVAIQAGVVLASLLFMRRMAQVTEVRALTDPLELAEETLSFDAAAMPEGIDVFEINGSFCFGAARKFTETLSARREQTKVVILRMRHVLAIDATGIKALDDVASRLHDKGARLFLSGVQPQPLKALAKSGVVDRIGREHLFLDFPSALTAARRRIAEPS